MKLEEAIETLQYHSERNAEVAGSDWADALKLGIEALKRCKNFRDNSQTWGYKLLPGETEE